MAERDVSALMRQNIKLLTSAAFWSVDYTVLRECPSVQATGEPMVNDPGLGLDRLSDYKKSRSRRLACGF